MAKNGKKDTAGSKSKLTRKEYSANSKACNASSANSRSGLRKRENASSCFSRAAMLLERVAPLEPLQIG